MSEFFRNMMSKLPGKSVALSTWIGVSLMCACGISQTKGVAGEIFLADKGVEEAAQEQAVKLGFIVADDNFDQWIFNQAGVVDRKGEQTRLRLQTLAQSRIDEIDTLCSLSESQKQKLELASRGDIVELFDRIEVVRIKFQRSRNDRNRINEIFQEIPLLQAALNSEQFGKGSFFHKSLVKTLNREQYLDYEEMVLERQRFQYRAAIAAVLAQLELNVPLLDEQREKLIELTLAETPMPKTFGQYTNQIVMAQMSTISEEKLKQILDEIQLRVFQQSLNQVRGMKQWLIQQGILEADFPRRNKDVDD